MDRVRAQLLTVGIVLAFGALLSTGLLWRTLRDMQPLPASFSETLATADKVQLQDREGEPLSVTYQNLWNVHDRMPLHQFPAFLRRAFIVSEDKRFFEHHGQDWSARLHALLQNIVNMRTVRGASTLSEQVVKMLHPRPRTLWSRWLEGWEASDLEQRFSKQAILEFYLNQVPFAANRRGVKQAARYYFDRDPATLSKKESIALAVLVRAPSRLDIYKHPQTLQNAVARLARKLVDEELLSEEECRYLIDEPFELSKPALTVAAPHFVRYVLHQHRQQGQKVLRTTLDGGLQSELQGLLDQRLADLKKRHIGNAALLVADHQSGEILVWVVGGNAEQDRPAAEIDAVTAYRQPGSALKPFLYALALEKGWTAATRIDDSPLSESVAYGLHQYRNYSRVFYGPVSLREALGNSLNIPALRTIQFVGAGQYLALLHSLGFKGLDRHPDIYGDGLALGNAEVTLLELVQAYAVLANRGIMQPLRVLKKSSPTASRRLFSNEVSSLIGNILSDPAARRLEFGSGSLLNLPVQTAVKTGTSSDFRDSWVLGYNYRYVVGLWMGNLDNSATDGVTGSTGPALVLRSVFSVLNRHRQTAPLYFSPLLQPIPVCTETVRAESGEEQCASVTMEYFIAGTTADETEQQRVPAAIRLRQPTQGLHLAVDPRLPRRNQAFEFVLQGLRNNDRVDWEVDGRLVAAGAGSRYLWPLQKGKHAVRAIVRRKNEVIFQTQMVNYLVK